VWPSIGGYKIVAERVIVDEDGSQQEVRKLRWGRDDDPGFLVLWVCSVLEETFNNLITQRPR